MIVGCMPTQAEAVTRYPVPSLVTELPSMILALNSCLEACLSSEQSYGLHDQTA